MFSSLLYTPYSPSLSCVLAARLSWKQEVRAAKSSCQYYAGDGQPFGFILPIAFLNLLCRKQHPYSWEQRGLGRNDVFFWCVYVFGGVWSVLPLGKGEPQCLVLQPHAWSSTNSGRGPGPCSVHIPPKEMVSSALPV